VLAFQGVSRRFGALRALDGVTFALAPGTLTALVGPNGSGKTTLLRVAATLDAPTEGTVALEGVPDEGAARRRHVGYLGQEPGLYEELTVRENLAFVADFHGHGAQVAEAAARFAVDHRLDQRVRGLSRGERQRAALARATLCGPLLLLDEPTTALDPDAAARAVRALVGLRGARTLLVATHDASLVAAADRVLRLDRGRLA
jgi:ABC-type multidrug transport system ATPase subunit